MNTHTSTPEGRAPAGGPATPGAPAQPAPPPVPPGLATSLRALPRAFWVKWAGTLLNRCGSFVLPFFTLFMTGRGFGHHQAGWALGMIGAGSLGAAILGGWLADRLGRRETMALSLVGSAVSLLLLGTATSLPGLLACCFVYALLADTMIPASQAMVADLVPPEHRLAAYTADRLAINLGFTIGPTIAGFMIEKSFWSLFVVQAITSVAFAIICLCWLPRTPVSRRVAPAVPTASMLREVVRSRPLLTYLIAILLVATVFRQFTGTFPLQMAAAGLDPKQMGPIFAINGLLIVLVEIPLTHLTRRWPLRAAIALGAIIIGQGFSLNSLGVSVPLVVASMIVLTVGEMLSFSRTGTYLASLSPIDQRGRYAGLNCFAWGAGGILGATLGLALYEIDPAAMWASCGALCLLAAGALGLPVQARPRGARVAAPVLVEG